MTSIELRQKLINQIERLSFEKLLVLIIGMCSGVIRVC
jgi:hypothetical protein